MKILNKDYKIIDTFDSVVTVPDCFVLGQNKVGRGHGEAKLYFGSKTAMREFYGTSGFRANCFVLKADLLEYHNLVKREYFNPSQNYIGKDRFKEIWKERLDYINSFGDVIEFTITDQHQIAGERGYVNSSDSGYRLIREISLSQISFISAMKLQLGAEVKYYWKLFVDFDKISELQDALVYNYGHKGDTLVTPRERKLVDTISKARVGQGRYREQLLEECPFCPITMVNDERLLIASHIKPWSMSNDKEKVDPKNGYMLTPLYDKLFDKGFITFTDDKRMVVSDWLSPKNRKRLNLEDNKQYPHLLMDDQRKQYLIFHREAIFKGQL